MLILPPKPLVKPADQLGMEFLFIGGKPQLDNGELRYQDFYTNGIQQFTRANSTRFYKDVGTGFMAGDFSVAFTVMKDEATNYKRFFYIGNPSNIFDLAISDGNWYDGFFIEAKNNSDVTFNANLGNNCLPVGVQREVVCTYNASTNLLSTYCSEGTQNSVTVTGGLRRAGGRLALGAVGDGNDAHEGALGLVRIWDRVIDPAEYFNGGSPKWYFNLNPAEKSGLISAWDGSEAAGSLKDHHGVNDLSYGGTRPAVKAYGTEYKIPYNDSGHFYGIATAVDKSGNNRDGVQTDATLRPLLIPNIINNHAVIRFMGSNQVLGLNSDVAISGDFSLTFEGEVHGQPSKYISHSTGTAYIEQTSTTSTTYSDDTGATVVGSHDALPDPVEPNELLTFRTGGGVMRVYDDRFSFNGYFAGALTIDEIGKNSNLDMAVIGLSSTKQTPTTVGKLTEYLKRTYED